MNLFLHVALPLGVAALVGIHVARIARPALLPPKRLRRLALVAVALLAALLPVPLAPPADLLALPGGAPLDLFFAFWLPVARAFGPAVLLVLVGVLGGLLFAMSRLWRPRRPINTSWVDEGSCTGCTTCSEDCPYEAITMVPRTDFSGQRSELVARVEPSRCVGCGICAGSCAPMGIGPFGRTGRDQLADLEAVLAGLRLDRREILIFGCRTSGWDRAAALRGADVRGVALGCAGSLHTSVIESALRRGVGGVLVLSCPERDCRFREGPKWLAARAFAGREAELHPRVDRTRLRVAALAATESALARRELDALRARVAELSAGPAEGPESLPLCETDALVEGVGA
jgi:coenzyme F420-reducing hydrogenase delta subunit/Pyruvate/2-oxoacid:ferredoxin oxidoreductase delta subunit